MGPLMGVKVVEIAGKGPATWCAMMLSDMGAEVLRVDRSDAVNPPARDERSAEFVNLRGRRSIAVDLKTADGAEVVLRLAEQADALIEGFRPGVVERLGVGPETCLARNERLIYGRMTGWGQDGPMAQAPGHDINYLALSGLLHAIGPADRPVPPLNLVGDYGGGGLLLAFGIVCALLDAGRSGKGQVIDAAMLDGSALLGSIFHGLAQVAQWKDERASNMLDGGAHYYGTYETADGRWVAIGAMEPKFYSVLLDRLGIAGDDLPDQQAQSRWPEMRERFAAAFRTRSRDEWVDLLGSIDTCFSPVLTLEEALTHEHNVSRGLFVWSDGVLQAAPAPRFSRTPGEISRPAAQVGEHTEEALSEWGFDAAELKRLSDAGAISQLPNLTD